jgi:hypothetical protein
MSPLVGLVAAIAVAPAVYPQVDLTLRRQFKLRDRLSLWARADFFNIFNHPNFGPPANYLTSPLFGKSTPDAGSLAGKRRPEWRPQPSLPDWRTTLDPVGA